VSIFARIAEWLGWHKPDSTMSWDGCSFVSRCVRCKKRILQDSQGGWFTVER
jgi:hypothetical protein